ncbi:hypothetical protein GGQ22_06780 [Nocardioides sp. zg-579]|uniref:Mce-associated membrane protein n=1 Tax=Nocardioides marmotae TaxID=2663857 RepID=A0A6I3J5X4_9ACTN|nr:hypothetical protein [Nocardioides marmotae]MCR6031145.1 hypothetical protein [Gordonia jinghuaiqii]MTB94784.1 hypothetical protein [Nocardioides marmotae]QKE01223.1 hypothetical protein HPC71_09195 [Nocardioides marmotae]
MRATVRSRWTLFTAVLAVLAVGLAAAIAVTALRSEDGRDALDRAVTGSAGRGDAELTAAHREVAEAARDLTLAFLEVDHADMEPLTEDVLALATGEFADQYAANVEQLIEAAKRNKSVSTGEVVALGVGDLDADSALVYVAADSEVQNVTTDGTSQPRYYRLQIDMVREDGQWLASNVQFVG